MNNIVIYRSQTEAAADQAFMSLLQSPGAFPIICGLVVFVIVMVILADRDLRPSIIKPHIRRDNLNLILSAIVGVLVIWKMWI